MKYNPHIHRRKSIRLKGYDYSKAGLYFITICVQNRMHLFGTVENGEMLLNDAGRMVEKWYHELGKKYPDKFCHEMVVMPNHFHCIIENLPMDETTDAHATPTDAHATPTDAHAGAPLRVRPPTAVYSPYGIHNQKYNATIGDVMDWYKTMTTNEYIRGVKQFGWQRFNKKLWQRNYYERIIRDVRSFQNISKYIQNNPGKWGDDKFYGP